jgi:hypothetical protein
MAEDSKLSIGQRAASYAVSPSKASLPNAGLIDQKGEYNNNIHEGQNTHIGDVYAHFGEGFINPSRDIDITKPRKFPFGKVHITEKLPAHAAVLYVYQNGDDQYSLLGSNLVESLLPSAPYNKPRLSLGHLVSEDQLPPEEIKYDMNLFSDLNIDLRKWLKKLRTMHKDELYLIVSDYTDYEIPWEMVELSPTESPNEYIGALINTARWQDVILGDDYLELECCDDTCEGNVVAYINQQELIGVSAEVDSLSKLNAATFEDIKDFQKHLLQDIGGCGLIYMACHGIFTENIRDMALGSLEDRTQQLKLCTLRTKQLKLLKNSRGIVFINACHSGRHQAHPSIPNRHRWGFAELFLQKGARGVIGTVGKVGDEYAAKFASEIIEAVQTHPNLSITAIIRKVRFEVISSLPEEPNTRELLPFIYSFMYVYYGNPMTILSLTKMKDEDYE